MCPEGDWGPILPNRSVKNVWGLRPHTFFTLSAQTRPPDPLRIYVLHNFNTCCFFIHLVAYLGGMDYYKFTCKLLEA